MRSEKTYYSTGEGEAIELSVGTSLVSSGKEGGGVIVSIRPCTIGRIDGDGDRMVDPILGDYTSLLVRGLDNPSDGDMEGVDSIIKGRVDEIMDVYQKDRALAIKMLEAMFKGTIVLYNKVVGFRKAEVVNKKKKIKKKSKKGARKGSGKNAKGTMRGSSDGDVGAPVSPLVQSGDTNA